MIDLWRGTSDPRAATNITFTPPIVRVTPLLNYAGPESVLSPAKHGDAGADLYATEDVVLHPGERKLIPVGFRLEMPHWMEAQIRPRSGASIKGLGVANSPGTVDSGYRDEVRVIATNTNQLLTQDTFDVLLDVLRGTAEAEDLEEQFDLDFSDRIIRISRGDRIAQMVFASYVRPEIVKSQELSDSERGLAGFGSTGL